MIKIEELIEQLSNEQGNLCHDELSAIEKEYESLIAPFLKNFYKRRSASLGYDLSGFITPNLASISFDFRRLLRLERLNQALSQWEILHYNIQEVLSYLEKRYSNDQDAVTLVKRLNKLSIDRFPDIVRFYYRKELKISDSEKNSDYVINILQNYLDTLSSDVEKRAYINKILQSDRIKDYIKKSDERKKLSSPPNGEYYKTHANGRSIVQFITEVYNGYLTGQFTRADLRGVDDKAEMALRNWERSRGRIPLTELNLPTLKEFNDKRLAASDEVIDRHEKLDRQRLRVTRRQNAKRNLTP